MPRYRFIKPPPDVLEYRDGQRLLILKYKTMYGVEFLEARKDQATPYSSATLIRAEAAPWRDQQMEFGFDLQPGSRGHKVMLSLVAKGYAEEIAA